MRWYAKYDDEAYNYTWLTHQTPVTHQNCEVPTEMKANIIDPLPRNLAYGSLSVIIVRGNYSAHDKSMSRSR